MHKLFVKMLGGESRIAHPIELLHLALPVHRNPLARRLAQSPIQQPGFSVVLEANSPSSKRPLPDPKQLRSFQLSEFRSFVTTQNILELDHTNPLEASDRRIQPLQKARR